MFFSRLIKILFILIFLASSLPEISFAWDFDEFGSGRVVSAETRRIAKEESASQKRFTKVSEYLAAARKARKESNFNKARKLAEKALKVEKNNRAALAFLNQLKEEERLYEEYKAALAKKKAEKRLARSAGKKQAKEAAARRKKEKVVNSYLDKSKKLIAKRQFSKARVYAKKALAVDPDSREVQIVLARIDEAEGKTVVSRKKVKPSVLKREELAKAPSKEISRKGAVAYAPRKTIYTDEYIKQQKATERDEPVREPVAEEPVSPEAEGEIYDLGDRKLLKLRSGMPIIVDGDTVEYFEKKSKIIAEGNVSIKYGDSKLLCDRIEVDTNTREAFCEGNVQVSGPQGTLVADTIRYDLTKKEGKIVEGELKAFPWFGEAEETAKVDTNEFVLKHGYVTTCDHDRPHYRIEAENIQVFPGKKVIAKNVTFYIGDVPVLWMPYYYHPVIRMKAKVQFIPGVNSDWGYFLLSAWRFHIKGDTKADLLLDYRTKKGFAQGVDLYYGMKDFGMLGLGTGVFRAYFAEQNGWGTYDKKAFRDEGTDEKFRKRLQWKHRIDFEPGTTGMFEFNKLSDPYVIKDYFYKEYEENNRIPPNYVSIISNQSNYMFSVEANARVNDFFTVVERLPEIKLDVPDQRLWKTPFYYSTETSATVFSKKYATDLQRIDERTKRLDSFHKLSFVTGIGPLNLTPYGTFRETVYSGRKHEDKAAARMAVGAGVNAFMRFHKIYDIETDFLGLDINKLRHIIVPSAKYYHRHQPTISKDTLYYMDDIDRLEKENGVKLALENKLQTKRGDSLVATDLIRTILSVDYNFRMKKNKFEFAENPDFRNIKLDLEIRPYDWLYLDYEFIIDPKTEEFQSTSTEFSLRPVDAFRLDLGYRYEKMSPENRNQITFDLWYKINPKWKLGLYERFNLEQGRFEEQQLSITRDLHCWEVEVAYQLDGDNFMKDDFMFWLAFKIKAFPDLPIGLNRSFTKRAPGVSQTTR